MAIYTVRSGDTLYNIARSHGTTADKLVFDNQLAAMPYLVPGQALYVEPPRITHTVVSGDTLYKLSLRYGVTLNQLLGANPGIANPALIYPGQTIAVPTAGRRRSIVVNGYTQSLGGAGVEEVMPKLTYISTFSYDITPEGGLKPINDAAVLAAAKAAGTGKLMSVTNTVPGEGFKSEPVHSVLTNPAARDALIENILAELDKRGYDGVNLDFEYVYPADRENYNEFLRVFSEALHKNGYILVTAVAPKISANQQGTLYEAHDYAAHGKYADYVVIMTYEWGYMYGPAMAVSPIGPVRQVLEYAASEIPPEKILMGMPNYGYDWTLPYTSGSAAKILTNVGAAELAARVGAQIKYDAAQQSPYFNYYDGSGKTHEVWFEDARSVAAKMKLLEELGLAGISWWTVDTPFRQGTLMVDESFSVRKP